MTRMRVTKECLVYKHEPYTKAAGDFEVDRDDVDMLLGTGLVVVIAEEGVEEVAVADTEDDLSFLEMIPEVADTAPRKKSKKKR